jgi:DME family drug/metabolite transporter
MIDSASSTPGPSSVVPPAPFTSSKTFGRLCILLAAVLWSCSGLFVKNFFDNWPDSQRGILLAFWRALFGGLLLLPAVRRPRWNWLMLPMALCFAAMSVMYLQSMTLTTAANAIWLQSTAPFWVFLIGLCLRSEPRQRGDMIPLVAGAIGVGLILYHELWLQATWNWTESRGVIYGLISGVVYAGIVVTLRSLRSENGAWLVTVNLLTTAGILSPYCFWLGIWPTATQWAILPIFGLLQLGIPYLLFARGLRLISSQEASGIALLEPVLVPIWVFLLPPHEMTDWWTLAGAGLILVGLILRYSRPQ